jgi:hypothetical protein
VSLPRRVASKDDSGVTVDIWSLSSVGFISLRNRYNTKSILSVIQIT